MLHLAIRYPNGKQFRQPAETASKLRSASAKTSFSDRGMTLEQELNQSNAYYLNHDVAVIHKKPTPIQIVNVDYPKRSAAVIKEAYFKQASTTDYNGVYRGNYIDFDAKETQNATSFPLHNFHEHQVEHMRQCIKHGGICFAIIKFVKLDQIFLFKATDLFSYWDNMDATKGRKSIPLADIQKNGILIQYHIQPLIPYLEAVNQLIDLRR